MNSTDHGIVLSDWPQGQIEHGNNPVPPAPSEQAGAARKADGGKDAWLFLAACTVVEALVWGLSRIFSFLFYYYIPLL
jgi:hypothetical protein